MRPKITTMGSKWPKAILSATKELAHKRVAASRLATGSQGALRSCSRFFIFLTSHLRCPKITAAVMLKISRLYRPMNLTPVKGDLRLIRAIHRTGSLRRPPTARLLAVNLFLSPRAAGLKTRRPFLSIGVRFPVVGRFRTTPGTSDGIVSWPGVL